MTNPLKGRTPAPEPRRITIDDYRNRIALDRHALDLAAEEQPELFLQIADEHVLATSRRDAAKDELLRTDARLGREARAEQEKAYVAKTGSKPTEGSVADAVLGQQEHLEAADKVSRLNREVDEWGALRSAMEHRKSMIRELATLYAAGYYTAGTAEGAGRSVRDTRGTAARGALAAGRARGDADAG